MGSMRAFSLSLLIASCLFAGTVSAQGSAPPSGPPPSGVACNAGGEVARSADGRAVLVSSAWGCAQFPQRVFTVQRLSRVVAAGTAVAPADVASHYDLPADVVDHDLFWVGTGGTRVVAARSRDRGAATGTIVVVDDGRVVRSIGGADLYAAGHVVLADQLFYEMALSGTTLVVTVPGHAADGRRIALPSVTATSRIR